MERGSVTVQSVRGSDQKLSELRNNAASPSLSAWVQLGSAFEALTTRRGFHAERLDARGSQTVGPGVLWRETGSRCRVV